SWKRRTLNLTLGRIPGLLDGWLHLQVQKGSNTHPETIVAEYLERLHAMEETVSESDDIVTQLINESTEDK
ncbi:hypothetical protein L915_08995, partial [Phytophthora nicotianae]